jgi:hypothetical protein
MPLVVQIRTPRPTRRLTLGAVMLVIAVGLVLIAAACAVVLMEASQSVLPTVAGRLPIVNSSSQAGPTDWRGAALNAHADSTNLQFAIVAALESDDDSHRDSILRSALRETGVRVSL